MKTLKIFLALALMLALPGLAVAQDAPTAPGLTNNPSLDVVVTNPRPVLSFFNAHGGQAPLSYEMQLSPNPEFSGPGLISYQGLAQEPGRVSAKRVAKGDELKDKSRYWWRVRAVDAAGRKGPWAQTRFFVDTTSDDHFMGLVRVQPASVTVSSGFNPRNIYDLDDPGQSTFWQSAPFHEQDQWLVLDLGQIRTISRIWMLSAISGKNGRLKDFAWQTSVDGVNWQDVPGGGLANNDTFRNIVDIAPTTARFWRLYIRDWHGYCAQINALCLYSPGKPPVPSPPPGKYVLVVGDQMNGYTFTQLARRIQGLGLGLDVLQVPHFQMSLELVQSLKPQPVAIIFSGNNAGYQNLPMFEYNGNYEIIRECKLPILGICCGHQLTAMAYGLTFARSMGWSDITALDPPPWKHDIDLLKKDPLFQGVPDPFVAPEVHGWAVYTLPDHYEALARSKYLQSLRRTDKMLYGVQFHPEIDAPYNQAQAVLVNFLKMALQKAP
ncbi:MAG: discoidin domain-containing protein [Proteobacteria bacterium]|nr:discoidin domain-containing protein [Pseudomonadota bacterium]